MKKGRTKSIVLLCFSKNAFKDIDGKKKSKKRLLLLTYIFSEKKSLNNVIAYRKKVQVSYAYHNHMIDLIRYMYSRLNMYPVFKLSYC